MKFHMYHPLANYEMYFMKTPAIGLHGAFSMEIT